MPTRPSHSLAPEYFDRKYAEKLDYWDFETSPYEAAKYEATLAALPRPHYKRAFEIGCSIGVLTAKLADRCANLWSVDVAEAALTVARRRCAQQSHVHFSRAQFPSVCPAALEICDLVVVSEVGYYWSREELAQSIAALHALLCPGGHLILVHYTPFVSDYPLTGDEVHEAFLAAPHWQVINSRREELYRLDVLAKP